MEKEKQNKKSTKIIIGSIVALLIIGCGIISYLYLSKSTTTKTKKLYSPYELSGNNLEKFDLQFLKLENEEKNKAYSPLSIKYALEMLGEGADGSSKEQLDSVIGKYKARKYENNKNMSLANAFFVKNDYKDKINKEYVDNLKSKYNAEVIYDEFKNAKTLNNWVSDKTFKLIENMVDDETIQNSNFTLVNALAIDMDWVNKFQHQYNSFSVEYFGENYNFYVSSLLEGYNKLKFNNNKMSAKAVEFGAVANKYDIVKTLGEDKIRKTVGEAYQKWLNEDECASYEGTNKDVNSFLDDYIKGISSNYKNISSSTDFSFYDDDNVKSFAKDLKTYNGTTLQYVGIMPKKSNLKDYIKSVDAKDINNIISNLKGIELSSFEEGTITEVAGNIPLFKFEYKLNLKEDLNSLGIKDVFNPNKANLSRLTKEKGAYIDSINHKTNIEFSNDGIKAAASTVEGGAGDTGCQFRYEYSVPVKKIDLTFDNPYLFIIRDKSTGEVWFTGTVYEPIEHTEVEQ